MYGQRQTALGTHVKNEQGILGRHNFRWAVVGDLSGLLVPPLIPSRSPWDLVTSALEDQDMLDAWGLLDGSVSDDLGGDGLSTAATLVGGDQDAGLAVVHAIPEGLSGEAGEDDGVDGADTRACKEGCDCLPCHGEIDRDGVALLNAEILEDVRDAADLAEKLSVGDVATFIWLVGFVNDGGLRVIGTRADDFVRTPDQTREHGADVPPYRGA